MTPWKDVRDVLGEGPDATRRLRQRARVLDGWQARRGGRRVWLVAVVGGVAAIVAGVVSLWPRAMVREADGTTVQPGSLLVATSQRELQFAEGSRVVLEAATRLRVDAVDRSRVELVLESGRIVAEVSKGTGRVWRYHAGDYVVRVVGTKLSVAWDPAEGAIDVRVSEGAVEVTGPALAEPVLVGAGQSLQHHRLARAAPPVPAAADEALAPASDAEEEVGLEVALADEPRIRTGSPAKRPAARAPLAAEKRPPDPPSVVDQGAWRQLLAAGKRRQALDAAASSGVLSRLDQLADADALALADAARLERLPELSRQLLGQVLARDGADAAEAAFLLGRLEADARKPSAAVTYFRRAVRLAPGGSFAEQSRGRLMEALLELQDAEEARKAATDYLAHHPGGAWSGLATKLRGEGPR